jgi:hypothetical protein
MIATAKLQISSSKFTKEENGENPKYSKPKKEEKRRRGGGERKREREREREKGPKRKKLSTSSIVKHLSPHCSKSAATIFVNSYSLRAFF